MKKVMKAIAVLMLMTAVVCATGCRKEDNANGDGIANGHTYVDLGLPSGTLWATCNVGADAPEEFGDYFAWGETQPKDTYNWSTYKFCHAPNGVIWHNLTKYCNSHDYYGYQGYTDSLTILQNMDDAATANWGSGWYTPTVYQWKELHDNTTKHLVKAGDDTILGAVFTANGRSIFLPASGERSGTSIIRETGCYWSSSLYTGIPVYAYSYCFKDFGVGYEEWSFYIGESGPRDTGLSVRPVRSAK